MNVRSIMTTPPTSVDSETPVIETARLMSKRRLPGVAVVARDGKLLGVVTEEDLIVRNANLHLPRYLTLIDTLVPTRGLHEYEDELRHMLATKAQEVMSEHLYSVAPDADVSDAATIMMEKHVNPLPVVDGNKLVGMISRGDIVRLMVLEEDKATGRLVPAE